VPSHRVRKSRALRRRSDATSSTTGALAGGRKLEPKDRQRARLLGMGLAATCFNPWEESPELIRSARRFLQAPLDELLFRHIARQPRTIRHQVARSQDVKEPFQLYERELWRVALTAFDQTIEYRKIGMIEHGDDPHHLVQQPRDSFTASFLSRWDAESFWLAHYDRMYDPAQWTSRPPVVLAFSITLILTLVAYVNLLPLTGEEKNASQLLTACVIGCIIASPCAVSLYVAFRLPRPTPFTDRNLLSSRLMWFLTASWGTALLFLGALIGALSAAVLTADDLRRLQVDDNWSVDIFVSGVFTPVRYIAAIIGSIAWTWLMVDLLRVRRSGRMKVLLSRASTESLGHAMTRWLNINFVNSLDTPPRNSPMSNKAAWALHLSSSVYVYISYIGGFVVMSAIVPWIGKAWLAYAP